VYKVFVETLEVLMGTRKQLESYGICHTAIIIKVEKHVLAI